MGAHDRRAKGRMLALTTRLPAASASPEEVMTLALRTAHDVAAPLRAFDFALSMMQEEAFEPAAVTEAYGLAREAHRRLTRVSDRLLAFARAWAAPLTTGPLDMSSLVREALAGARDRAGDHRTPVDLGPLPPLAGDHAGLTAVFEELLDNALRYGAERDIRISVTGSLTEAGPRYVVADTGPGIPRDLVDRAFEPFGRLHAESDIEGTGLGLSIAERIVERHGGTLIHRPHRPKGAEFELVFPQALSLVPIG